jgi:Transposase zinc-binding domain
MSSVVPTAAINVYNPCRYSNNMKCQGLARAQWLEDGQAELLDVPYFHVVFTVPAEVEAIAFQNQTVVYDILCRAASESLRTIAADPVASWCEIGFHAVLHTSRISRASPASSFSHPGRRDRAGRRKLDRLPARVLPAGQGAAADVPGIVPARPGEGIRGQGAKLLLRAPSPA